MSESLFLSVETTFRSSHELKATEDGIGEIDDVCDIPHGHSYRLIAKFKGSPDPKTGLLFPRSLLAQSLDLVVRQTLDLQNLNDLFQNTSGEEIAKWCFDQLKVSSFGDHLVAVELIETKKNSFYYPQDILV